MQEVVPTVSPYSQGIDVSGRDMSELFPEVDPQFRPYGARVLIQLRRVVNKTKSGIILAEETQDNEAWNMQVGKIIAMGPLAFKNRKDGKEWPEGMWAKVGDYVRFPRWGGDRLSIPFVGSDGKPDGKPVVILILNDSDLWGEYTGDPRDVRAYID